MSCTWNNPEFTEILLTKSNGDTLILKEKMCVKFTGRECVRLETFIKTLEGPDGITYLPWRGDRWATYAFSIFKGDTRRLVCSPTGIENQRWGQHIDWDTVEVVNTPEHSHYIDWDTVEVVNTPEHSH